MLCFPHLVNIPIGYLAVFKKAKTFIALLAKATFLHSGAVQRKSTKNTHITVPEILFEQLY